MKEQPSNAFGKNERLHSRTLIEQLFKESQPFLSVYPLRMVFFFYTPSAANAPAPTQFLISVPKRSFRKATLRNYVKRQIRESVRTSKSILYSKLNQDSQRGLVVGLIYTGKGLLPSGQIEDSIKQLFQKFEVRA